VRRLTLAVLSKVYKKVYTFGQQSVTVITVTVTVTVLYCTVTVLTLLRELVIQLIFCCF